jgi:protein-L-isoaspartate O-methyltransferase
VTRSEELAAGLRAAGILPAGWADAFDAVDRAAFIPEHCWVDDENGDLRPIGRDIDPDRWNAAVYSDEPIVTQLDGGRVTWPAVSPLVTSSASQPSMVVTMLGALGVRDGEQVLEIGSGTGYNAGLLAHRLGDNNVTTVEVDQALADQARANLAGAGYQPLVVCGDGAGGWPAGAP